MEITFWLPATDSRIYVYWLMGLFIEQLLDKCVYILAKNKNLYFLFFSYNT